MNEVSCRVFDVMWRPLDAKGIEHERIVAGTSVPLAKLRNKKERIGWSEYAAIMANIRPHFTDDEYVDIGRSFMRVPALKFAFVVARLAFSPIDLYRWSNKPGEGLGNQMFTCVHPSYRELSKNDIKDPWGTPYTFKCPGTQDPDGADVISAGPDKQPGTEDDIKSAD